MNTRESARKARIETLIRMLKDLKDSGKLAKKRLIKYDIMRLWGVTSRLAKEYLEIAISAVFQEDELKNHFFEDHNIWLNSLKEENGGV